MIRGLGCLPDRYDRRDITFSARRAVDVPRAEESNLWELVRWIRDQLSSSTCVGQAVAGLVELRRALDGLTTEQLSALAIYWGARAPWPDLLAVDGGATLSDALRFVYRLGVCAEKSWPFDLARVQERPSADAEIDGVTRADGEYQRITETGAARVEAVLDALQARNPVVMGLEVTSAFMQHIGTDTLPAPKAGERRLGGHALLFGGFGRHGEIFRVINSYGRKRNDRGMLWMDAGWVADSGTRDVWVALPRKVISHA